LPVVATTVDDTMAPVTHRVVNKETAYLILLHMTVSGDAGQNSKKKNMVPCRAQMKVYGADHKLLALTKTMAANTPAKIVKDATPTISLLKYEAPGWKLST
jgi:hypothetical protein